MKVLQSALRDCAVLGLGPDQSLAQKYPINRKNVQILFILCFALTSCYAFLFREAETFQECAIAVHLSSTFMLTAEVYVIFLWKNQSMCKLIDTFEKTINDRESWTISVGFF